MVASLNILVIEDDPVYSEFLVDTLTAAGHVVAVAASGAVARTQVASHHPDVVVLDLGLPDGNGYELARSLRSSSLPVGSTIIMLTAQLHPQRDMAEAAGIDIVLSKPVEADAVIGLVDLVHERRNRSL
jgi:DNA-binding response OmpR family regulator